MRVQTVGESHDLICDTHCYHRLAHTSFFIGYPPNTAILSASILFAIGRCRPCQRGQNSSSPRTKKCVGQFTKRFALIIRLMLLSPTVAISVFPSFLCYFLNVISLSFSLDLNYHVLLSLVFSLCSLFLSSLFCLFSHSHYGSFPISLALDTRILLLLDVLLQRVPDNAEACCTEACQLVCDAPASVLEERPLHVAALALWGVGVAATQEVASGVVSAGLYFALRWTAAVCNGVAESPGATSTSVLDALAAAVTWLRDVPAAATLLSAHQERESVGRFWTALHRARKAVSRASCDRHGLAPHSGAVAVEGYSCDEAAAHDMAPSTTSANADSKAATHSGATELSTFHSSGVRTLARHDHLASSVQEALNTGRLPLSSLWRPAAPPRRPLPNVALQPGRREAALAALIATVPTLAAANERQQVSKAASDAAPKTSSDAGLMRRMARLVLHADVEHLAAALEEGVPAKPVVVRGGAAGAAQSRSLPSVLVPDGSVLAEHLPWLRAVLAAGRQTVVVAQEALAQLDRLKSSTDISRARQAQAATTYLLKVEGNATAGRSRLRLDARAGSLAQCAAAEQRMAGGSTGIVAVVTDEEETQAAALTAGVDVWDAAAAVAASVAAKGRAKGGKEEGRGGRARGRGRGRGRGVV